LGFKAAPQSDHLLKPAYPFSIAALYQFTSAADTEEKAVKKTAVYMVTAACLIQNAWAAPAASAAPDCDGLKVATGPAGKGYSKLFADIAKVCGNEVPVCEVLTSGGLDNLNAMSTKEADIGIAQIDTVLGMKNGDENIAGLQAVASLNFNYLHVVTALAGFSEPGEKKWGVLKRDTNVTIKKFTDLKGKTIALVGSAQLLGRQLERQLTYGLKFVDVDSDSKAFEMVKRGEVAATLTVSGWPSGTVASLKSDSGLSLVPFDAESITEPYQLRPLNYKGLGVYNNKSLAVPNLLLTRPFKGEKALKVAKLKSCIATNLTVLQEGSYQPAWNEIKDLDNSYAWKKFEAPAAAVSANATKKK
jgi:TRAP-type uncharacterized transport system substrate-binding protein